MRLKKQAILLVLLVMLFPFQLLAQDSSRVKAYRMSLSYVGDFVRNFRGGLGRESDYLGLANARLTISTEALRWWSGGEFQLNLANTHGGMPSDEFVGDFQGVSNIQAGDRTFFQEFWYCQTLGRLSASVGIQDMNAEFSVNGVGAVFVNSSFALHSTFSDNIAVPVFPITGLGAVLSYRFTSANALRLGVFDGNPDFVTIHPASLSSPFEGNDGFMSIIEHTYNKGIALDSAGSYKFGFYYHSKNRHADADEGGTSEPSYGFYFVGNQRLTASLAGHRILDGFLQLSYSPVESSTNRLYAGAGLVLQGLATADLADELGLAVGYAHLHGKRYRNETVVELTYKYPFALHFYIQPDIQYVINPSRFDVATPNALVGILRVGIEI